MKHYEVHFEPDKLTVKVHHGATLLETAGLAGIILSSPCGGVGRCRKCKVELLPAEKEVLACQYIIEHDTTVRIPESSRFFKQKILEHGIQRDTDGHSSIKKVFVPAPKPQIDLFCNDLSNKLSHDVNIGETAIDASPLTLWQDHGVTAVVRYSFDGDHLGGTTAALAGLEKGDTSKTLFGVAVDIGTTTVVARLINLTTSQILTTVSTENPQGQYGADVISRISYSEKKGGLERLHQAIVKSLNDLILQASEQCGIDLQDIYEIVAAGNTTMNHLLLEYPVSQLGKAPYQAYSVTSSNLSPEQMGFHINPRGNIHTIANIAGFVGSDTVAAALACGMDITELNTLLVDIGTNGEIVYGTHENLLAASCAAGPALEGAGIEFGSPAQSGAIERVVFDENDIDVDVIGNRIPHSICGSGLIDAIAVMLNLEIIDSTGRFTEVSELPPFTPEKIRKRLINYDSQPAFVFAGKRTSNEWQDPVLLTQKDVRQLQLAKAAIRAGIELLLKNDNKCATDIQQLLLAGAFGNYIIKENAVRIGLLPNVALDKIHFVGNAAGSGAEMVLISQKARRLANDIARNINYIEIAHQAEFQSVFSDSLFFPEK